MFSLFNGENSHARALALANRVWREVESESGDGKTAAAIRRCYALALGREPSDAEASELVMHWKKLVPTLPAKGRPSPPILQKINREAVEENTGERFTFEEQLFSNAEFKPDLQPR